MSARGIDAAPLAKRVPSIEHGPLRSARKQSTRNQDPSHTSSSEKSNQARRDMESLRHEPFWLCQWREVVFLHLETDSALLQQVVPFELDLLDGRAFVSLVAFTLKDMRPRFGGRFFQKLFQPFGTHRFLNIRTYVKYAGHTGIYFIAEYLDAPWLNQLLGPALYGLPFKVGKLEFAHGLDTDRICGTVTGNDGVLAYAGSKTKPSASDDSDSGQRAELAMFLLERYRAFTNRNGGNGWFPVWHLPWHDEPIQAELVDESLLAGTGEWSRNTQLIAAHYSEGLNEVWMGLRRRG